MSPMRPVDLVRQIASLMRRMPFASSPSQAQYPTPGWGYDPPPRIATFVSRGGRIGLAVAAGLGVVLVAMMTITGTFGELFLAELIPELGVILDCLTLIGALVIAICCYYAGILVGLIVYAVAYAVWRRRQSQPSAPTNAP